MKSDSIVIIPTYNEKENIEKIIRAVFGLEKQFDILVIDDDNFSKVKANYDSESRKLTIINKKNKSNVFEIVTLINSNYSVNDPKYKDYTMIMKNSGFVYLAKVNKSSDIDINIQTLKDMIKVY